MSEGSGVADDGMRGGADEMQLCRVVDVHDWWLKADNNVKKLSGRDSTYHPLTLSSSGLP